MVVKTALTRVRDRMRDLHSVALDLGFRPERVHIESKGTDTDFSWTMTVEFAMMSEAENRKWHEDVTRNERDPLRILGANSGVAER